MSSGHSPTSLLSVTDLCAGYGKRRVIERIGFDAAAGQITAIIGPNGSGKSTLLKALLGLNTVYSGKISLDNSQMTALPTHRRVASGMIYLPQGNRVFDELTVRENLELGGITLPPPEVQARIEEVLPLFPQLQGMERRAAYTLSGGERQMVAFARAMVLKPRLLMLDEPSIGLSPKLVGEVLGQVQRIRDELGCAVLIVEQKVEQVLNVADNVLALRLGRLEFCGKADDVRERLKELFL